MKSKLVLTAYLISVTSVNFLNIKLIIIAVKCSFQSTLLNLEYVTSEIENGSELPKSKSNRASPCVGTGSKVHDEVIF